MYRFTLRTSKRREILNVTSRVREGIARSGVQNGLAHVTVLHTTCAMVINDANSGWEEDMMAFLEQLVPDMRFHHLHDGPQHAKSHILGALLGPHLTIGVDNGHPVLGTWQSLFMLEFEGPRERSIAVQTFAL